MASRGATVSRTRALPRRRYSQQRFLPILWANHDFDRTKQNKELEDLRNLFGERLGFEVEDTFLISKWTTNPKQDVTNHIKELKENLEADELLVIFYAGHGSFDEIPASKSQESIHGSATKATNMRRDLVWQAQGKRSKNQYFTWNGVQFDILFPGDNDVLVILDCCYAERAYRGSYKGRKQIMAACNKQSLTDGPGEPDSFTGHFINVAQSFTVPFSVSQLIRGLQRLNSEIPDVWTHDSSGTYEIYFEPKADIRRGLPVSAPTSALAPAIPQRIEPSGFKTQPVTFFAVGRVLLTVSIAQEFSTSPYTTGAVGDKASRPSASHAWRFVVIHTGAERFWALKISTTRDEGREIDTSVYGVVYIGPRTLFDTPNSGARCQMAPLRIATSDPAARLDSSSVINYAKLYTFDYGVKVRNFGYVEDRSTLTSQFNACRQMEQRRISSLGNRISTSSATVTQGNSHPSSTIGSNERLQSSQTLLSRLSPEERRQMQNAVIRLHSQNLSWSQPDAWQYVLGQFSRMRLGEGGSDRRPAGGRGGFHDSDESNDDDEAESEQDDDDDYDSEDDDD